MVRFLKVELSGLPFNSFRSDNSLCHLTAKGPVISERNFNHVEQLFNYGSAIRKIMYTTNAIESVHSGYRKVTKKGAFPNENALLKLLYLRTKEFQKKWDNGNIQNWSMVLNQLMVNDQYKHRIEKCRRF